MFLVELEYLSDRGSRLATLRCALARSGSRQRQRVGAGMVRSFESTHDDASSDNPRAVARRFSTAAVSIRAAPRVIECSTEWWKAEHCVSGSVAGQNIRFSAGCRNIAGSGRHAQRPPRHHARPRGSAPRSRQAVRGRQRNGGVERPRRSRLRARAATDAPRHIFAAHRPPPCASRKRLLCSPAFGSPAADAVKTSVRSGRRRLPPPPP